MPRSDYPSMGLTETIVASAARGASGDNGGTAGWGVASRLRLQLLVSAASGTNPTLDVFVEDSVDGGANWNLVGTTSPTFTRATGATRQAVDVTTPFGESLRIRWVVGGTGGPSFTFKVDAYAEPL